MNVPQLRFKDDDGREFPGWEDSVLGDVCEFKNGKAHESLISDEGRYIVINSKFISSEGAVFKRANSALSPIDKDSLVIVMSDVPNGKALAKCFFVTEDNTYTVNQRIGSLKSKSMNNKFIFYQVNRNPYYLSFDSGVGQTNLKKDEILGCPISLPKSVKEQTKIANFLTAIDKKITQLTQKHDLLKQYKKGVMQQIFSQKLRFKDDDGREFPEWRMQEIGNYLVKHEEKSTKNNQYPVLTSSRKGLFFQKDYFNGYDVASKDNTGYNVVPRNYFTYRHMSDDLIFTFNRNNIVDKGIVSTLYPVFTTRNIDDDFLEIILNYGNEFKEFAIQQKQGGSRTYMYFSKLEKLELNLPCKVEQTKIANFLTAIDDKITQTQTQLEAVKQYKKGLLQQMFV